MCVYADHPDGAIIITNEDGKVIGVGLHDTNPPPGQKAVRVVYLHHAYREFDSWMGFVMSIRDQLTKWYVDSTIPITRKQRWARRLFGAVRNRQAK